MGAGWLIRTKSAHNMFLRSVMALSAGRLSSTSVYVGLVVTALLA